MLLKLVLQNFRRHTDLTIDFTGGINVMRAMNEGGKSTCLESVAYALFGSKALRTPLEQCVTWGEDVKTLKVELTLTAEGKVYTYKRSKAGAEIILDGKVFCTGQNEVTAFSSTLMGADAATSAKLMFASQGSIRGALDGGPKELSVLIEELSSMGVFDQILEAAQTKLALGSPALLEERLKGAEATLDAALQNLPALPDADAHRGIVRTLSDKIAATKESLPALELAASAAEKAWRAASVLYMDRVTLESNVEKAEAELKRADDQVSALAPAASTLVTDSRPALRQELAEAEDFAARQVAYLRYKGLPNLLRWPAPVAEYRECAEGCATNKSLVEKAIEANVRKALAAEGRRITAGNCSKCGQPTDHLKHVVETNAAVDAELATLSAEEATLRESLEGLCIRDSEYKAIQRFATELQPGLNRLHAYVTLDESTYPPYPSWVGTVPGDVGVDTADIKARLSRMEAEVKAVESAQAKYELAVEQRSKAQTDLSQKQTVLAAHQSPTADTILELTEAKDNASLNLNAARGEIILAEREMAEVATAYEAAQRLWSMAQSRVDDSTAVIAACKKDLGSLAFNNGLVKKLRAIRPVVANRVWASVLSATSVMFSQMRGEPSVVTKETSGFLVNGQSVASLSGSTLDLLGLALRVSMTRTFIPNSGLLVLDEACAAMDSERTEAMLGFIASAGYQQVLLVTHEEISSSIADNLIQI